MSGSTKPPADDGRPSLIQAASDPRSGPRRGPPSGPPIEPTPARNGAPTIVIESPGDAPPGRTGALARAEGTAANRRLVALRDRLAGEIVLRHCVGRVALDLGHGVPQIAAWVRPRVASLVVADAVDLGHAAEIRLPWRDRSFEFVYSLRTVPHLGHDEKSSDAAARSMLREIGRILTPGGVAVVEIDNPRSLWGAYHGIRHPGTVIERGPLVVESDRGITRFDTLGRLVDMLPAGLALTEHHGIRVFAAWPRLLTIPLVGGLLERLEWFARDRALLRGFGAHLLAVVRRLEAPSPEGV